MDEKSLTDLLANLIPSAAEDPAASVQEAKPDAQTNLLMEGLQALAGQAGGRLPEAVAEFLSGKGDLHAAARSARSKKSAVEKVEAFLTENLKVSPALAALIAPLVVNLLPALGGETQKPRRRRKAKPKTEASSSAKKPRKKPSSSKPKPAASAKPKPSTASKPKPKPKKKPASSTKSEKKESKPKAKPKKSTRTPSGDILDSSAPPLN